MNTNCKLPQVLILGAAFIASTLACSVYAADATISLSGEIIPAYNGAKVTASPMIPTSTKPSAPAVQAAR